MGTRLGGRTPETTDAGVGQTGAVHTPMIKRMGWPAWLALSFAVLFIALTVLVATGVTQSLDSRAIHHFRPTADWWGDTQKRYSPWMSRLRPERMFVLLAFTSLVMSIWRRSWWPVIFSVVLAAASVVLTLPVKFAIERPDPHGYVATSGGSYPSGHMLALLVCLGGCLLVVWPKVHWWLWAPVVVAAGLMTAALVVAAAHWPTDVLGGAFLALAVVTGSSRLRLRQRAHRSRSTEQTRAVG
jgi:membrane-associated phospholipid phosphatase